MNNTSVKEIITSAPSGFGALALWFAAVGGNVYLYTIGDTWAYVVAGILTVLLLIFSAGFAINDPNESHTLTLFGQYKGTLKEDGFFYVNPFFSRKKISLRAQNLNGTPLKVNDKLGNPIEIAAVVVWQVNDTAKAAFEVEDFKQYVSVQSEAAVRHLANLYAYDNIEDGGHVDGPTLRDNAEVVNSQLVTELNDRLERAGIKVLESRISHLAYAPEIAGAMLQKQQATAVVAARKQIVEGAVGMVELALEKLEKSGSVKLDEERKAAMVSNLMVVLCSDRAAQPVVNTGTLYN